MNTKGIMGMEAAGMLSLPMYVFIRVPCWMEKVCNWAKHVFMMMVLRRIGIILVRIFTSSTCVTVQTFHFFASTPSGRTAALSRTLFGNKTSIKYAFLLHMSATKCLLK
ncbi:hypothetical protein V8G54_015226 [Vigna mungo]|uniref:Uncharacterized protein n=1 Tax=Vigna mungo TaxID=3915 RepID=A0AAQ3RZZ8_VIGMU